MQKKRIRRLEIFYDSESFIFFQPLTQDKKSIHKEDTHKKKIPVKRGLEKKSSFSYAAAIIMTNCVF